MINRRVGAILVIDRRSIKIVIAPDKFKGSLTSLEAARAMERGVIKALPNAMTTLVPMADGGEGLVDAYWSVVGGSFHEVNVKGPLGDFVTARFLQLPDGQTTVMEMSSASGLTLIHADDRDPVKTSTYGTGELLLGSLSNEAHRKVIMGIGGSATNDGGAGFAQALGYQLLDIEGNAIPPGGGGLERLARIVPTTSDLLKDVDVQVACDVDNPLCGPRGASAIYGPQKGADPAMIARLDRNLAHFATIIKRDLGVDVADVPGAGAAGGLGAGMIAFASAKLFPGIDLVIEAVGLRSKLDGASLCLTGEGRVDASSAHGKTIMGVGREAKALGVPTLALCGTIGPGAEAILDLGIDAFFSICSRPMSIQESIDHAGPLLEAATHQAVRCFLTHRK